MTEINRLRRLNTDPYAASSHGIGPAIWTIDRPQRAMLDKARDAVAMLVSFINLQETAIVYRDADENGDDEEQVSIEAAMLAKRYIDELLTMANEAKGK